AELADGYRVGMEAVAKQSRHHALRRLAIAQEVAGDRRRRSDLALLRQPIMNECRLGEPSVARAVAEVGDHLSAGRQFPTVGVVAHLHLPPVDRQLGRRHCCCADLVLPRWEPAARMAKLHRLQRLGARTEPRQRGGGVEACCLTRFLVGMLWRQAAWTVSFTQRSTRVGGAEVLAI